MIALDSHIRLANPRTPESESSLMLRRGYSYSLGVTNSGQLDMGLLFVCYQHDLEKGFLTVQKGSMAKRWRNTLNLSAAVIFFAAGSEGRERLSRKRVIAGLMCLGG